MLGDFKQREQRPINIRSDYLSSASFFISDATEFAKLVLSFATKGAKSSLFLVKIA